jgi:hypothetical protein
MRLRSGLALLLSLTAVTASAEPLAPPAAAGRTIREAAAIEAARAAVAEPVVAPAAPARRRNWFQRHPVGTAALAGFLSGFAIGWAAGDDGVFDDFTGEFNGVLLGGIGAGSAASVVGIVRAARR